VTAWTPGPLATSNLALVIAGMLLLQFTPPNLLRHLEEALAELPIPAQGALLGIIVATIFALGPRGIAPFIYFQF